MKRLKVCILFPALWMMVSTAHANTLSLETQVQESKSHIGLSYELSQFSTEDGSIQGSGGRLTFLHSFNQNWSTEVFLSAALNTQGGVQNSFTGVGGYALYTLFGTPYEMHRTVSLGGHSLILEKIESRHTLFVGAGINQYFLNGNEGVYSSSGLSATAIYQFELFRIHWKASARYAMMTSADVKVTGISYDFGFTIPL